MLRIRFTEQDLARVVFAASDHSETLGSVRALYASGHGGVLSEWRSRTEPRITTEMLPLLEVVGRAGAVPDFLSPEFVSGRPTPVVADALDRVRPPDIAADLDRARADRSSTAWLRRLADGDRTAVRQLQAALRAYHACCVEEVLPSVRVAVRAELARQAQLMVSAGLSAVLSGLGAAIRWNHPVLEVRGPFAGELSLDGRGLRLVPSVLWPRIGFVHAGYRTPTLVYPMQPRPPAIGRDPAEHLAVLLGRTRAEVLAALTRPAGTAELAERVGVSCPTASEHAAALRAAGLVVTRRRGRSVCHDLTPLGARLLAGS